MESDNVRACFRSAVAFVRRPVVLVLILGLAIRLILMPIFAVGYDSNFWALIVRNIESGNGLYELEGYYYTPIWGYILGAWSVFQETFLNIDILGTRLLEALPVESYTDWFLKASASLTSVEFNFWVKIPFVICDAVVGYLIYWLIKDRTDDERKASWGFALWFLCPVAVVVTSVSGMFDTFSVLFTMLCMILVYKDRYFLGGAMLIFAVLTKFFPAYLLPILVAYVLLKHRSDGKGLKSLSYAVCGGILAFFVIMLPQMMDGTFVDSFSFITNRSGGASEGASIFDILVSKGALIFYAVMIMVSTAIALKLYRSDEAGADARFFKWSAVMIAALFLYPAVPQYLVLLVPFLVYLMVTSNRRYMISWILLSIGVTVFVFAYNFTLILSLGAYTGLVPMDFILSMAAGFQTPLVGQFSAMSIIYLVGGMIQYAGVVSVLWIYFDLSPRLRSLRMRASGFMNGRKPYG